MTKSRITEKNLLPQVTENLFAILNNNCQVTNNTNFINSSKWMSVTRSIAIKYN
jgi:hypothetical protein